MVALNVQCSMFNGESSLQLPASRTAALVATLASATLGDVLLARCCGSSLRINLLPTHLVGELAAALGYAALLAKNLAATVQPSRLRPLAAFSISAVATFRVPRPSGDGYNAGGYLSASSFLIKFSRGFSMIKSCLRS